MVGQAERKLREDCVQASWSQLDMGFRGSVFLLAYLWPATVVNLVTSCMPQWEPNHTKVQWLKLHQTCDMKKMSST